MNTPIRPVEKKSSGGGGGFMSFVKNPGIFLLDKALGDDKGGNYSSNTPTKLQNAAKFLVVDPFSNQTEAIRRLMEARRGS